MLKNIQYLRAFAALAVVFYHALVFYPVIGRTELQGVNIFFVISGFIIPYVGRKSIHQFAIDRLVRVVPIYWCITIFMEGWLSISWKVRVYVLCLIVVLSIVHVINKRFCDRILSYKFSKIFIYFLIFHWIYKMLGGGFFRTSILLIQFYFILKSMRQVRKYIQELVLDGH